MREDEIDNVIGMFSTLYLLLSDNSKSLMMGLAEKMLSIERQTSHVDIQDLKDKQSCIR